MDMTASPETCQDGPAPLVFVLKLNCYNRLLFRKAHIWPCINVTWRVQGAHDAARMARYKSYNIAYSGAC
jgi:hypothetical protein